MKKKILVIHTKYKTRGGEDIAVENEINFLKKYYEVKVLYFTNNTINILEQLVSLIFNKNKRNQKLLTDSLVEFDPDLVYIHNTWFNASLDTFKTLKSNNKKIVIKIHNFRYNCTKALFPSGHLQNNSLCPACGYTKKYSHFINKYFSNSFIKSIFVINYGKKYFKIIKNEKLKIFVLTNFHKKFLVDNNIRTKNIKIVPNFLKDNISEVEKKEIPKNEEYFIYAGRISEEKGLKELITAFLACNFTETKLKIIGDGPLLKNLKKNYAFDTVEFLGEQKNDYVLNALSKSKGVVTATKLFEGQPNLLCEASLMGIPSIFPKTGGISEFFPKNYQFSFRQYDYSDLKDKFIKLNSMKNSFKIGEENKKFLKEYLKEDEIVKLFDEAINSNE